MRVGKDKGREVEPRAGDGRRKSVGGRGRREKAERGEWRIHAGSAVRLSVRTCLRVFLVSWLRDG